MDHPVRIERMKQGLSQTALARAAGIDASTIQAIEAGASGAVRSYILMGQALKVDYRQLFPADESSPPTYAESAGG